MREAGFEPAHPEITELKPVALTKLGNPRDHRNVTVTNIFEFFIFGSVVFSFVFLLNLGPNNASITTHTLTLTHPPPPTHI